MTNRSQSIDFINPSQVISPNGLTIVDCLFWHSDEELKAYKSARQFAQEHNLYQPRLSQLMSPMRLRSVFELKEKLRNLPISWWQKAFLQPQNRRYLSLFHQQAKPYHTQLDFSDKHLKLLDQKQILFGPIQLAIHYGYIRDINYSFWGTPQGLNQLKKIYRLIPGEGGRRPTWYLASPKRGMIKEALLSSYAKNATTTSRFRCLYDLYNMKDERVDDILPQLMKKVFYEI